MHLPSVTVETCTRPTDEKPWTLRTTRSGCKLCPSHRPQNGNRIKNDPHHQMLARWAQQLLWNWFSHCTHHPSCSTESRSFSTKTRHQEELAHSPVSVWPIGPSKLRPSTPPEANVQWTIHLVPTRERRTTWLSTRPQQNFWFSCPHPAHQKSIRDVSTRVPALACTVFGRTKTRVDIAREFDDNLTQILIS